MYTLYRRNWNGRYSRVGPAFDSVADAREWATVLGDYRVQYYREVKARFAVRFD
jgi:hypothetical protein